MFTPNGLPTVYEEDEDNQNNLDMEEPPAANEATAALNVGDLAASSADHSADASGPALFLLKLHYADCRRKN